MSWNPGISWGQNQSPTGIAQTSYGVLSSDQQAYFQQQQSIEWQAYQKQLAQWQSQYGEQVSPASNIFLNTTLMESLL